MKKLFIGGLIALFWCNALAQEDSGHEECGHHGYHEKLSREYPSYKENQIKNEKAYMEFLKNPVSPKAVITIPVVVHVVWFTQNQNLSDQQIYGMIDQMNRDFRKRNTDINSLIPAFQGIAADCEIEFCLASTDPNGNPTTGITRTNTHWQQFDPNSDLVKTSNGGKPIWDRNRYLNIWTCPLFPTNLLGYAPYPGAPAAVDGVVLNYTVARAGRKTATHEVGHWLNLKHIWGQQGGCVDDDGVSDTPMQNASTRGGCPTSQQSCNTLDMVQNFMDYSSYQCKVAFTEGQKARMLSALTGARRSLLNSNACGTALPPIADFSVDKEDLNCELSVQFTDESENNPSSWFWTFGDGNTSQEENPSHTYDEAGSYSVSLQASNSVGNDTETKTDFITITFPQQPQTTGDFIDDCINEVPELSASGGGNGYDYMWYLDENSDSIVHVGANFSPSTPEQTTSYWVSSGNVPGEVQSAGLQDNSGNGRIYDGFQYLIFDVFQSMTIQSVYVYSEVAKERTIELRNSSGTVLQSRRVNIGSTPQRVELNFVVEPGTNYQLGTSGNDGPSLFRGNEQFDYPFEVPGIMSIKQSSAGTAPLEYYYFFYDWEVSTRGVSCESDRVEVFLTIDCIINDLDDASVFLTAFSIHPNPANIDATISLELVHADELFLTVIDMNGQTKKKIALGALKAGKHQVEVDLKDLKSGAYHFTLQGANGLLNGKLIKQ